MNKKCQVVIWRLLTGFILQPHIDEIRKCFIVAPIKFTLVCIKMNKMHRRNNPSLAHLIWKIEINIFNNRIM